MCIANWSSKCIHFHCFLLILSLSISTLWFLDPWDRPHGLFVQVLNENIAMQALEMDISNHIPIPRRRPGRLGTSSAGTQSWKAASVALSSKKKKDKDKQKGQCPHDQRDQGCSREDQGEKQPNSCPEPETDAGPVSNSQFLELPNSMVKVGSSELLGPIGESNCKEDMDKKQSSAPATTAEKSDLDPKMHERDSVVNMPSGSSRRQISPSSSPSRKERNKVNKVSSVVSNLGSEGPKKVASVTSSGREGSLTRTRRASCVELNRAVSKANITEVFKVREMELTADLSPRNAKKSTLSQDRPKVTNLTTEEESDSESELEVEEEEEEEEEEASIWLNFSPLNTLITGPVSKILGLVPLFDVVEEEKATWKSSCKKLISRLYHWALLLILLFQLVLNLQALGLCHANATLSEDQYEQCTSVWWPPMALNTGMSIGVILVLMSWGGIFKYQDRLIKGRKQRGLGPFFF